MNYLCEKATGAGKTCDFRSGKIILQQEIAPEQMKKLLTTGKTDLLTKFISKRTGRAFKAFLVAGTDGKVGFEFPPREPRGKAGADRKPKEPPPKIDFTGQDCRWASARGAAVMCSKPKPAYVCEKSQADKRPCKFKVGKMILQQPIEPAQVQKLLQARKTDLLDKFISKAGKPFPAFLVMDDKGKVTFEFPPRDGE